MYEFYNPNPLARRVGDCTVRALSKALDTTWEDAYAILATAGFNMCDMPSSDSVWSAALRQHGFNRKAISNTCPDCYTAEDFCNEHPHGIYVLAFGGHVATVVDGVIYDAWDSRNEVPMYYFYKAR